MITPLHDNVFLRMDKAEDKSKGGIYIPQEATETPRFGEVVAVGPGKLDGGQWPLCP